VPVSIAFSKVELDKLRKQVLRSNLKKVEPKSEHEALRISDDDIQLIVYKSGKIVHNDAPDTRKLLNEILTVEAFYDYLHY
jgi:ribonuclease HIII